MASSAVRRAAWGRCVAVLALAASAGLSGCVAPRGGLKRLTLESVYGPNPVDFNVSHAWGLTWLDDGRHYLEWRDDVLQQVDAVSDAAQPAYDSGALERALLAQGDFDAGAAARGARHPAQFSADRGLALLEHAQRWYAYHFAHGQLVRLTEQPGECPELTISPDNTHVAFVRDNNLYTIDTTTAEQKQLTQDGSPTLLNGVLDWVYQEELYGRGNWRAYWWSEDGGHLAYLQLDESEVPVYPLVDYVPIRPKVQELRYPKAGDPNPRVRLGIVPTTGGATTWVDLAAYEGTDILISGVSWSPDGRVVFAVQDREQRWLHLDAAGVGPGTTQTLVVENSPAWVEYYGPPHWLKDGTFVWRNTQDGWAHLYHYAADGTLLGRVTSGAWEVRALHGVDEVNGWVYFSGTRDSHVESHAYRVRLNGSGLERLTTPGFSHGVNFDPQFRYFFDTFSSITAPTQVHLRRANGELERVISANEVPALREYRLSTPEMVTVPTPAGHNLHACILRPPDFNRSRKYPVLTLVYGGPHMPMVENRWEAGDYAFHQWLAQQGYIIWAVDPHSAGGEGAVSAWHAWQKLGVVELADLEESLRWLAAHECADLTRVGIVGHSYGGFMAAFALTHSQMFKMGIAGSALLDWRNYDSVYAERLMRMPEHNIEGYLASSAVTAAGTLHGRLLLVHGAVDDNVHLTNVWQFIEAARGPNRQFDLMIYPSDGHGVGGAHWDTLQLNFILENL